MNHKTYLTLINLVIFTLFGQLIVCGQNTRLIGIDCGPMPKTRATHFQEPMKPINGKSWKIVNPFGNVLTSADIKLPPGYWQHTGVDYSLNGSATASQNQTAYAAADGVVVFSTKTASNINPVPSRGGLVIIKHVAPPNMTFSIPSFEKTFKADKEYVISHPATETPVIYTYYLHLNPDSIFVSQNDMVKAGDSIAQTYSKDDMKKKNLTYPPHLHFEVWKTCSRTERDGYDSFGSQFKQGVDLMLVEPTSFLQQNAETVASTTSASIPSKPRRGGSDQEVTPPTVVSTEIAAPPEPAPKGAATTNRLQREIQVILYISRRQDFRNELDSFINEVKGVLADAYVTDDIQFQFAVELRAWNGSRPRGNQIIASDEDYSSLMVYGNRNGESKLLGNYNGFFPQLRQSGASFNSVVQSFASTVADHFYIQHK